MIEKVIIREMKKDEYYLLEDLLYEAVFQKDKDDLIPREVIYEKEVNAYIKDFGKKDDNILVAEYNNIIIGGVWTRIISGEIKGYGYIDDSTPEFAISIYEEYRNNGIGTRLMLEMMEVLKDKGYKQTSLAVQKENYAVKMYEKLGFQIIKEGKEDFLMLKKL